MAESKIKSHSRRSKDGKQVRVKEGRRKSIGKKIAIAGATGVGLVGLGLAGRKLVKEITRQKNIREFNPTIDSAKVGMTNNYKPREQTILEDSQERLGRARNTKKRNNTKKVRERIEKLKENTKQTIDVGGDIRSVDAVQLSWNSDKKVRKQAAKQLAKTARDLRAKGKYS
jgi:oligoendopeptidase F